MLRKSELHAEKGKRGERKNKHERVRRCKVSIEGLASVPFFASPNLKQEEGMVDEGPNRRKTGLNELVRMTCKKGGKASRRRR